MSTPVTNFGKVTVSIGYNASATSIVLTTGHGSRLPSTFPFPLTWWNFTDYPDPADDPNREIVTVTNRVTDTLTITRGAESISATTKNTSSKTYKMALGITKAMWESIFDLSLSQSFRGLSLQTHPNNDMAAKAVQLIHADSITMDDGEEVASWDNLVADLTSATGVGGLDTGSEAASTWYEVYGVYNGATKGLVLHRAKDYFLDETWDQSGGTTEDGQHALRDATARTKLNQGFQVDTAGKIEFIDVKLVKVGTPSGGNLSYWFTIEGNNGGVPNGTPVATSDKLDATRLTTTAGWVRIPFRTPFTASAATQYHLVLQGDFTVSGANYIAWRADTTTSTYAKGSKAAYDGATWTNDTDDDFLFKVYVTRNDTSVTMPAGYAQKALIGYCYNNASSNLKHFWQKDHDVFCGYDDDWQIGAIASSPITLVDLAAFIPPVAVTLLVNFYNGTGAHHIIGNLAATDISVTATVENIGSTRSYVGAGETCAFNPLTLAAYQGMMFAVGGGTANLYVGNYTW